MAKMFPKVPLKCLKCGHEFTEAVAKLEATPQLPCPACGIVQHYDAKAILETLRRVERQVEQLGKTTTKTIKLKF